MRQRVSDKTLSVADSGVSERLLRFQTALGRQPAAAQATGVQSTERTITHVCVAHLHPFDLRAKFVRYSRVSLVDSDGIKDIYGLQVG